MKLSFARKVAVGALLAAVSLAQACAYTTVTKKDEIPALGPPVQTKQAATMPEVKDMRRWPVAAPSIRLAHVRIFADQITDRLRKDLVDQGLFTALPDPDSQASDLKNELLVTVQTFNLIDSGKNPWVVPHLLADGLLLPVFTVTTVASGGDVDMGGYYIPSTKMSTNLEVDVLYKEGRWTILDRSYLIELPLGSVSQRELFETLSEPLTHGAQVSKEEGFKALDKLAETMTSDPYWAHLNQFKKLVMAERAGARSRPLDKRVVAVEDVLDIIEPMAFAPDVADVLRDGSLEAEMRAGIVNELRIRHLGLDEVEKLPPDLLVDEEKAKELFDDPAVEQTQVQAVLIERVLTLAVKVLTPSSPSKLKPEKEKKSVSGAAAAAENSEEEKKDKEEEPEVAEPDNAAELRAELRRKLVKKLQGKPNVHVILLELADKAVGKAWKPMLEILENIDSPLVKSYLKHRQELG